MELRIHPALHDTELEVFSPRASSLCHWTPVVCGGSTLAAITAAASALAAIIAAANNSSLDPIYLP